MKWFFFASKIQQILTFHVFKRNFWLKTKSHHTNYFYFCARQTSMIFSSSHVFYPKYKCNSFYFFWVDWFIREFNHATRKNTLFSTQNILLPQHQVHQHNLHQQQLLSHYQAAVAFAQQSLHRAGTHGFMDSSPLDPHHRSP